MAVFLCEWVDRKGMFAYHLHIHSVTIKEFQLGFPQMQPQDKDLSASSLLGGDPRTHQ